jgi:pimeloyl-ACP methyl ester carboxylesterase
VTTRFTAAHRGGSGEPLVLLHGFTQTRQSWRRTVQALEGRYRALTPDLPGHGQYSERPASFAAATAYIRALEPDILAGYSMGGRIALHAAFTLKPQRLILVGASPGIQDANERAQRKRSDDALADRIEQIGIEAFATEWGAQPLFEGQPERVRAAEHDGFDQALWLQLVDMGIVSAKRTRTRPGAPGRRSISGPLEMAKSPSATSSVTLKTALKSGSSQQGKARRQSVASICVVAITCAVPSAPVKVISSSLVTVLFRPTMRRRVGSSASSV